MIQSQPLLSIARLSSGSSELDHILDGGLPVRSLSMISGQPGSGKTILALQMLFHLAHQGRHCIYFTTLAEPTLKLIRYMQLFTFFDQHLIDDHIVFADLGSHVRLHGAERVLAEVIARVEREEPDLVVIDSFRAVRDLLGDVGGGRAFVYDLAVSMAGWGVTGLLVGEYTPDDLMSAPEFSVADGIIHLGTRAQELATMRVLEVIKLRGANYVSGQHSFEITADGVAVYPRVRVPEMIEEAPADSEREATGVAGLDALLGGGLLTRSSTIVQGSTGTDKSVLALNFLVAGALQGERGILFGLEETPAQLRDIAAALGWDISVLEAKGLLMLVYTPPLELSRDRFLYEMRRRVQAVGARRVVLDSASSVALGIPSERGFRELIYAASKHFRAAGVTTLITLEVAEQFGPGQLTGHGVSSIADNLFVLRHVEVDGGLERAISVLKARGMAHETAPRRFTIGVGGIRVGGPFTEYRGVLTGIPVPIVQVDRPGKEEV